MADIHVEPEAPAMHQCWCLCIYVNGGRREEVPCHMYVVRDRPFCNDCEDRHEQWTNPDEIIITTRPLPG